MSALPIWLDVLLAALVVVGAGFALIGSFGLAKLSDFFKRAHGPTKASTLGVGCVLIASSAYFTAAGLAGGEGASLHELMITLFVFLTAPVSAHLLAKAALQLDPTSRPQAPITHDDPARRSGSEAA
jgi:multicomponent K+:H+ antiporter subunit G